MATSDLALGQNQGASDKHTRVINDFSINVATVNGSGSQSANSVLLKSIFGKFPAACTAVKHNLILGVTILKEEVNTLR